MLAPLHDGKYTDMHKYGAMLTVLLSTQRGCAVPLWQRGPADCGGLSKQGCAALLLKKSFVQCCMLRGVWLSQASKRAILNANYMASRLKDHYKVLYTGKNGTCAHEFIIDLRPMKVPCAPGCRTCLLT